MQKLSVRTRLAVLAIAIAVISLGVGAAGLLGVSSSIDALREMFEGRAMALQAVSTINELTTEARFAVSDAILDPSAQKTEKVTAATSARIEQVNALMTRYLSRVGTDKRSKLATRFASDWNTLRDKGLRPAVQLLNANNLSEAQWVETQTIDPVAAAVKAEGTELRKLELAAAQSEYDAAHRNGRTIELVVACIIVVGLAVVGMLCLSMARNLLRDLGGEPNVAADVASRVAQGDLSMDVPVRAGDTRSVLYAMQTMQTRLAAMVGDIRHSTDAIAGASSHIATGNRTLSVRTEEHAASIQETAASMQELASMVKANAEHAIEARHLAGVASDKAGDGDRAAQEASERMSALAARSTRVRDITSVIEAIAFQTNLLALNAAVEAARAGNEGRGFAVVAQEVRALAERSSKAAREIGGLIAEMATEVEQSSDAVHSAGQTILALLGAVQGATRLMDSIADSSQKQSAGIQQVNSAVSVMDRVTQQNAAFVHDAAQAAGALEQQASSLRAAVGAFQL